jgi:hypothetical protein
MDRRPLALASGAFLLFALATLIMTWSTDAMLGSGAGAFLTLAVDLNHGIFYRPLLDDTGIGGTRYFPLVFVLNAWLIRLGFSPVIAGRTIAVVGAVALIWAAVRVLEELDVPRRWAYVVAPLTLCSSPGVFAINTIRGDLLPVALNLWGVVFAWRMFKRERLVDFLAATGFFVLAILAKATAAYAVGAVAIAIIFHRKPKRGLLLAATTVFAAALLPAVANAASHGRMLESMRACMFGGGLSNTLRAPMSAVYVLIRQDPLCSLLLIFFFVSLLTMPRDGWREPLTWLAIGSLAMTVFLFASPGVDINHLLDFYSMTALFIGYQVVRERLAPGLATRAMAVGVAFTLCAAYLDVRHSMLDGEISNRPVVRQLVRQVRNGKPILASDGFIPSAENERSFMLDNWMYQMLRRTDPRFDRLLQSKIAQRYFGAVVLQSDVNAMPAFYGDTFAPTLLANYELAGRFPPYVVFRLKP